MIVAAVVHAGTFALWPEMSVEAIASDPNVTTTIDLGEIPLPKTPEPLARPATPVMATTEIGEDLTIEPTTWDANPVDVYQPPPSSAEDTDARATTLTPYTVRPEILNVAEVQREMARLYPPSLRDAGIGGTVELSLYIDENGQVLEAKVLRGSGHGSLDAAALRLSDGFRFSPALNRDKRVAVWVSFPVVFQVRR
jgi:protein TonB